MHAQVASVRLILDEGSQGDQHLRVPDETIIAARDSFNAREGWSSSSSTSSLADVVQNQVITTLKTFLYSLRSIILFASIDVFRYILVVDTSVLAKSNMGRREYEIYLDLK
jgi:hypothetical protein